MVDAVRADYIVAERTRMFTQDAKVNNCGAPPRWTHDLTVVEDLKQLGVNLKAWGRIDHDVVPLCVPVNKLP